MIGNPAERLGAGIRLDGKSSKPQGPSAAQTQAGNEGDRLGIIREWG
jgi:hypothetical protein